MDVLTGTITPKRMPFSNYLSDEYNEIDIFVPFELPPLTQCRQACRRSGVVKFYVTEFTYCKS